MYFNPHCKWILVLCFIYLPIPSSAQETETISAYVKAQPNKCVALNQGRQCFTKMSIEWQLAHSSSVCMHIEYASGARSKISCWDNNRSGQVEFDFQSAQTAQLRLVRQADNHLLASTPIQVSWLYQASSRKRRWRLF